MNNEIITGEALESLRTLPDESVDCVITSPPYWGLRDYGVDKQLGVEPTYKEFISKLADIFDEVKRVLKPQGTCWINIGDTYNSGGNTRSENSDKDSSNSYLKTSGATEHNSISGFVKTSPKAQGLKPKTLMMIPARLAIELCDRGWILRQDIIWAKPNPMPESMKDRCTKAHEYVFLLAKSSKYYFDSKAIREPMTSNRDDMKSKGVRTGLAYLSQDTLPSNHTKSFTKYMAGGGTSFRGHRGNYKANGDPISPDNTRNKRSVWTVATKPFKAAHFATFPEKLIEPMILAGCPEGGIVLDPFFGAGTTGVVAKKLNRDYIGIELNPEYVKIAEERLKQLTLA